MKIAALVLVIAIGAGVWFWRTRTPAPGDGPECRSYTQAIERLATCTQVEVEIRDVLRFGYDRMKQAWTDAPADTPAERLELEQACGMAVKVLNHSVGPRCGW